MAGFFKILDDSYKRARNRLAKSFINDGTIRSRIDIVALCLKNRAGVRALLAGLFAKMIDPKVDIRKPYSNIAGETGKDSYSGRSYDESYIQKLTAKPYNLPINATTAFLTPGFRTKNVILTTDVESKAVQRKCIKCCSCYWTIFNLIGFHRETLWMRLCGSSFWNVTSVHRAYKTYCTTSSMPWINSLFLLKILLI